MPTETPGAELPHATDSADRGDVVVVVLGGDADLTPLPDWAIELPEAEMRVDALARTSHAGRALRLPAALLESLVNMRRSVDALGPAMAALKTPTSPALASGIQATENLWAAIDEAWGLLGSVEVAELLGSRGTNRSFASSMRKSGKIIGVERGNAYVYPGFQFDRRAGRVLPVVRELIAAAREIVLDDEDLVYWLCTPSGYFGDDPPALHLTDDAEIVDKLKQSESIEW